MTALLLQIGLGLLFSGVIAGLAYWRRSLSRSGVTGAVIVGTTIFAFGGWPWGLTLITFFVASSALSRVQGREKERIAAEKFDKGSTRDLWQAMANAGIAAALALLYYFLPQPWVFAAFVGAIATANADTWATELGVLSKRPPLLITSFRPVEYGTSGGVSAVGTLATLAGGLLIGLAMLGLTALDGLVGGAGLARYGLPENSFIALTLLAGALGGLGGSLFDSLLGATVQATYWSKPRQKETEKRIDPDGTANRLLRGFTWLNNDLVNFSATAAGALLAALLTLLL